MEVTLFKQQTLVNYTFSQDCQAAVQQEHHYHTTGEWQVTLLLPPYPRWKA